MNTLTLHSQDPFGDSLASLLSEIRQLRQAVDGKAQERLKLYGEYFPGGAFTKSARNLAHYLALRQFDLRHLQDRLARAGLSSLGRSEAYVMSTLDSIIELITRATGDTTHGTSAGGSIERGFVTGQQLLELHTAELFGKIPGARQVHIMVTLSSEAAWDYGLVLSLMKKGMSCARINCAHDNQDSWRAMIGNLRRAQVETGRELRILMDLAGHKLRTGTIEPQPAVRHIKTEKDAFGRVIAPTDVVLVASGSDSREFESAGKLILPIGADLDAKLRPGDRLYFTDGRDKNRYVEIVERKNKGSWSALCPQSAYVPSGLELTIYRKTDDRGFSVVGQDAFGNFSGKPQRLRLFEGDHLLLTPNGERGKPALRDTAGNVISPAQIGCTLPAILGKLRPGQPVWLDDGKLGTEVEGILDDGVLLRVTQARPNGVPLGSDKGLNFPETELDLPTLSDKDLVDLDFACQYADMIGFSFVETLRDMECLFGELRKRNAQDMPIIAKIETNRAVKNLPEIILGTIGRHKLGIMIARGDLSVELGSVRLAEVQEELLWLCEAAHVPVIWATQVLETIAKKGARSRPEFTDAAMGVRAECVMLNKGPYILKAVEALEKVLTCMQDHQRKKFSRMRALHW